MTTRAQLAELDAVIAELKAHPERHNQQAWVFFDGETPPVVTPALDCGSAFCIAGGLVARAGGDIQWVRRFSWDLNRDIWTADHVITPDDRYAWISRYAAELLGLDEDDSEINELAERLFSAYNTMNDIDAIRNEIAATVSDDTESHHEAEVSSELLSTTDSYEWPDDDIR